MSPKSALLLALLLLSGSSFAAWTPAGNTDKITIYSDPASIRKQGNVVKMWAIIEPKIPSEDQGKTIQSIKIPFEFNCKQERSRLTGMMTYEGKMGSGALITSETDLQYNWAPVSPGSPEEVLSKIACAKK